MANTMIGNLDDYMKVHGYERIGDLSFDDKLLQCVKKIEIIDFANMSMGEFKYIFKHTMKRNAKKFYEQNFELHKVGYMSDVYVAYLLNNLHIHSIDEIVRFYNNCIKYIDPFKIPIDYVFDNSFGGTLVTEVIKIENNEDNEYLKYMKPAYSRVMLPKTTTELSTSSYIHELGHALVETNKGIIEEYYNSEVISIYLELLYAYYSNDTLYHITLGNRINHILSTFNSMYEYKVNHRTDLLKSRPYDDTAFHSDAKYLLSTLKAIELLSKTIDGEKIVKHQIGRTISGHRTLEDTLSDVAVTNESCLTDEHAKKLVNIKSKKQD